MLSTIEKIIDKLPQLVITLERNRFGSMMLGVLVILMLLMFGLYVILQALAYGG